MRTARALAEQVCSLARALEGDGLRLAGDFTLGLTLGYDASLPGAENPYLVVVADAFGAMIHLARREISQVAHMARRQISLDRSSRPCEAADIRMTCAQPWSCSRH